MHPATFLAHVPLLVGFGTRILLQRLHVNFTTRGWARVPPAIYPSFGDRFLSGLWQGVLLHLALSEAPALGPALFVGLGARVLLGVVQFFRNGLDAEGVALAVNLLSLALAVVLTDVLENWLVGGDPRLRKRKSRTGGSLSRTHIQDNVDSVARSERASSTGGLSTDARNPSRNGNPGPSFGHIVPRGPDSAAPAPRPRVLSELELDIAELGAQEAAAAAQKRRFEEERKWAWAQGNPAWASQLAWQIKRYEALESSFRKEARIKMRTLEAQHWAVNVAIHGNSYVDEITDAIIQRLVEARRKGKTKLRVALSGPHDYLEEEVKPEVKRQMRRLHYHVVEDQDDRHVLYIDVQPTDDASTTVAARSDEWSRELD